jgi:hypothetical protein
MDGVFYVKGKRTEQPLLSLPFQLLSFTLASSAKTTHALLSGRDRNRAVTLASLYIAGMFATYLKAGDNWDKKTWEEVALESFENSSIAGYLTDVYRRVEDLTGYGPRAAIGAYDFLKIDAALDLYAAPCRLAVCFFGTTPCARCRTGLRMQAGLMALPLTSLSLKAKAQQCPMRLVH